MQQCPICPNRFARDQSVLRHAPAQPKHFEAGCAHPADREHANRYRFVRSRTPRRSAGNRVERNFDTIGFSCGLAGDREEFRHRSSVGAGSSVNGNCWKPQSRQTKCSPCLYELNAVSLQIIEVHSARKRRAAVVGDQSINGHISRPLQRTIEAPDIIHR